jgi:hypothetical protein
VAGHGTTRRTSSRLSVLGGALSRCATVHYAETSKCSVALITVDIQVGCLTLGTQPQTRYERVDSRSRPFYCAQRSWMASSRWPPMGRYSCAACDGAGFIDEHRYRELTETPGPLFISASLRSPMQEAAAPAYVLTVTSKNRKRELERTRRQATGKAVDSRRKRSRKSHLIIADSDDG